MDIWEQAVETYLAMDRGLFLSPQYLVGTPGSWEANPDFLAIVFPKKKVWMVEVTKRPGRRLLDKIIEFEENYVSRIRSQLENHKVIDGSGWSFGIWLFLPEADIEKFSKSIASVSPLQPEITALEETLKPSAWNHRFRQ